MSLKPSDAQKLMHDCKRIAKGFKLAKNEKNKNKRDDLMELLLDEFDRLLLDISEMTSKPKNKNKE